MNDSLSNGGVDKFADGCIALRGVHGSCSAVARNFYRGGRKRRVGHVNQAVVVKAVVVAGGRRQVGHHANVAGAVRVVVVVVYAVDKGVNGALYRSKGQLFGAFRVVVAFFRNIEPCEDRAALPLNHFAV